METPIDVDGQNAAIAALHGPSPDAAAADVRDHPERYCPPVLYALASLLFARGRHDEGAFWYYSGQLRARFDIERCADRTVGGASAILRERYGAPINRWTFADEDRVRDLAHRAVEWDRATPHEYDHRWINLHGMDAFLGAGGPLSIPEAEWPALADRVRTEYLEGMEEAVQMLRDRRSESE